MNANDIQQKLSLLPEGIAESNLQSWEEVVSSYRDFVDNPIDSILPDNIYDKVFLVVYNFIKVFSKTEQAKLFRAGKSVYDLMISTADEHGLRFGDLFVRVTFEGCYIVVQYETTGPITENEDPNIIERRSCNLDDDLMIVLQPLLNLLWNETRGKKIM
jgi:hypothetical protein